MLGHVLHHRLEDKEDLREVPGLHDDDAELYDVLVGEDREEGVGQRRTGGSLATAAPDVLLTSLVQHRVYLLVVVVVIVYSK